MHDAGSYNAAIVSGPGIIFSPRAVRSKYPEIPGPPTGAHGMQERTWLRSLLIAVIASAAVFANLDLFIPGYEHSPAVTRFLSHQGEPAQRSLELRQGLDLRGGLQVLLEARPARMQPVTQEDMELATRIIQNRIDALGVVEPHVQTQGLDKIVVELPGVDDPELAVKTIGSTARLEFIYGGDTAGAPLQGTRVATTFPTLFREIQDAIADESIELDPNRASPFLGDPGNPLPELTGQTTDDSDTDSSADSEVEDATTDTDETEPTGEAATESADEAEAATESADEAEAATESADEAEAATESADEAEAATETADEAEAATETADEADEDTESEDDDAPSLQRIYPTVIDGEFVEDASVGISQFNEVTVNFVLNGDGGRRMRDFSSEHVGEIMSIVLDGEVVSSPVLNDAIGGEGQITGNFTQETAEALAVQINSGALPVTLDIVGQTQIGASLGEESVLASINGGIIGLGIVMLFMLLYYRMAGAIADIALILYALLTLALFRWIPVTLTLAGIAGFILSIGMAVDANILIFERMKEELRSGRRVIRAMETGFQRAWPSIRDSNISTLITCAILFWFGNQFGASIVKGFAVTLSLGVVTSLFTAITVTRTLLILANRFVLRGYSNATVLESPRLRALFGF